MIKNLTIAIPKLLEVIKKDDDDDDDGTNIGLEFLKKIDSLFPFHKKRGGKQNRKLVTSIEV